MPSSRSAPQTSQEADVTTLKTSITLNDFIFDSSPGFGDVADPLLPPRRSESTRSGRQRRGVPTVSCRWRSWRPARPGFDWRPESCRSRRGHRR